MHATRCLRVNVAHCLLIFMMLAIGSCHTAGLPLSVSRSPIDPQFLARANAPLVGQPAPPFFGRDLDDNAFGLGDFRGKVVVVYFWNSWCPPAIGSLEFARVMHLKFEGQPFVLLGVNNDESEAQAGQVASDKGLHWRSVFDREGLIAKDYLVDTWPTFLVIDPDGKVVCRDSRKPQVEAAVRQLLAETSNDAAVTTE